MERTGYGNITLQQSPLQVLAKRLLSVDQIAKAMPHLRRWTIAIRQGLQQLIKMEEQAIAERDLSLIDSLNTRDGHGPLDLIGAAVDETEEGGFTFDYELFSPTAPALAEMVAHAGGRVVQDRLGEGGTTLAPFSMALDFGEREGERRLVVRPATGSCAVTDRSIDDLVADVMTPFGRVGP